jgi:hypothetical protein
MVLAAQTRKQKIEPCMIAIMGVSGSGKSVYLGMLMDILSRHSNDAHLLARGAFSINLQQATIRALARCRFPEKTPNEPDRWNWVHCEVRHNRYRRPIELILPDMAGEAIYEEIQHPRTYRVVTSFLRKAVGAMILIDAKALCEGKEEHELFTMRLTSHLLAEDSRSNKSWTKRPIAFVFSKADQSPECREAPELFAQSRVPGLWQQCRKHFRSYKFFASGVAGACVEGYGERGEPINIPLRIEPHGIVEPFEWLISKLRL